MVLILVLTIRSLLVASTTATIASSWIEIVIVITELIMWLLEWFLEDCLFLSYFHQLWWNGLYE